MGRAATLRAVGPFLVAALIGGLALPAGWPYWQDHPVAGFAATLMGAALAAAGVLLSLGVGSRPSGRLLIGASVLAQASWISTWDAGALPVVGEVLLSWFFFALLAGLLPRRRPQPRSRGERGWLVFSGLVLLAGPALAAAVVQPGDLGYTTAAHWPHLPVGQAVVDLVVQVLGVLYIVVGLGFVVIVAGQQRGLPGPARRRDLWLAAGGGVCALTAVAVQYPVMATSGVGMSTMVTLRGLQLGSATLVPLGLFASALVDTWDQLTAAGRLQARIGVIAPSSVQDALRDVLRDRQLRLWLWVETRQCYVDADGHVRPAGAQIVHDRVSHRVSAPNATQLAVLDLDRRLLDHPRLLDAVSTAAVHALLVLQLQVRGLEQLRDLQARLLDAQERVGPCHHKNRIGQK